MTNKKFHIVLILLLGMAFSLTQTSCVSKRAIALPPSSIAEQLDPKTGITVRFARGEGKYALDEAGESWYARAVMLREYYPPMGNGYIAPWKLIPEGTSDVAEAYITATKGYDKTKLKFALKDGTPITAKETDGKWTLTLPGVKHGETYEVYALYQTGREKYATVGKLRVVSYRKQQHTVTLVEVNGKMPETEKLEREVNAIYNPYGITFTVKTDISIKGNSEWDLDGDSLLNLNGSGFFSKESDEMRALRQVYQRVAGSGYDRNGYYLFICNQTKADAEPDASFAVRGDMPRGKQFGYIFTQEPGNMARLAAHELGHGIFTLRHTFDGNHGGEQTKAQTQNLMDYAAGTELAVWQWNFMANPAPLTWFDDVEEGLLAGKIWFTPDWKPFSFNESQTIAGTNTKPGTVPGIQYKGRNYLYKDGKYVCKGYPPLVINEIDLSKNIETKVYLFGVSKDCKTPTYSATYEYAVKHKEKIDYNDTQNVERKEDWICPENNVSKSYNLITSDASNSLPDFIKELRRTYDDLVAFYKRCDSQNWKPGKEPGIIPKCFWENTHTEPFYYYSIDDAFIAGVIDGGYAEVKGLYDIGVFLTSGKLEEKIGDLAYAYTLAYLFCKDETIKLNKTEYEELVVKLSELQAQESVWSWLQEKYYQPQAENLSAKITKCENANQLREEIAETLSNIKDVISNFDEIKRIGSELKTQLSDYYNLVTDTTNAGRYEAGRLVVPALSTVISLTKISKVGKTKSLLKAGKELTEKEADELVEKLIQQGKIEKIISNTEEIIYPTLKINGIPVVRILTGRNGKIAIIGRKMPYVRQVANDLKKLGKEVEIFEPNSAFGGKGYGNLTEIYADFDRIKNQYPNGIIPYEKLKSTLWYKENKKWANWIKEQKYDIYDLGDNPGQFINSFDRQNVPDASAFYDMEKFEIFKSK